MPKKKRNYRLEYDRDQAKRSDYRKELNAERRKRNIYGNGNSDVHVGHVKFAKGKPGGKKRLQKASTNFANQPKRKRKA